SSPLGGTFFLPLPLGGEESVVRGYSPCTDPSPLTPTPLPQSRILRLRRKSLRETLVDSSNEDLGLNPKGHPLDPPNPNRPRAPGYRQSTSANGSLGTGKPSPKILTGFSKCIPNYAKDASGSH